jgi:hypothetical protein
VLGVRTALSSFAHGDRAVSLEDHGPGQRVALAHRCCDPTGELVTAHLRERDERQRRQRLCGLREDQWVRPLTGQGQRHRRWQMRVHDGRRIRAATVDRSVDRDVRRRPSPVRSRSVAAGRPVERHDEQVVRRQLVLAPP